MRIEQGIILLATSNPYYGRLAYNLAMSIKVVDAAYPVAVVHDGTALNHLSDGQRGVFDYLIPLTGATAFGAKLQVPDYSPFEKTLFLDADMAWLPKRSPRDLIASLGAIDFASITEGHDEDLAAKYYFWADLDEIRRVYDIPGRIFQWRSEAMYFARTERVLQMFEQASSIQQSPAMSSVVRFGGHVPDELGLNIACACAGIEPHVYKWKPAYWPRLHGEHIASLEWLYTNYYALSCGSNVNSMSTKKMYDRIIKAAAYKLGRQHLFPLINKKDFLKERQIM